MMMLVAFFHFHLFSFCFLSSFFSLPGEKRRRKEGFVTGCLVCLGGFTD